MDEVVNSDTAMPRQRPFAPERVAFDKKDTLFVGGREYLRKVESGTGTSITGGGAFTVPSGAPASVSGMAIAANGDLYFSDIHYGIFRVNDGRIYDVTIRDVLTPFLPLGPLVMDSSLAFDPSGGLLIAARWRGLFRLAPNTQHVTTLDRRPAHEVTVDPAGNIYYASSNTIIRIDASTLAQTLVAGSGPAEAPRDGTPATDAGFTHISGLAADHLGNVYVADLLADRVWRLTPKVEITTATLPPAQAGKPYSASLGARYGTLPYGSWKRTAGAVPLGLGIDPASGQLTGTPQSAGVYAFTVQVTDAAGISATKQLQLVVREALPVTMTLSPQAGSGIAQNFTISVTTEQAASLHEIQFLIGDSPSAANEGCKVGYRSGLFGLIILDSQEWVTGVVGVPSNGRCTIDLGASSASTTSSGTQVTTTVTFVLRFNNSFTGSKKLYLLASSLNNWNSGWVERGTWIAGAAAVRSEPTVVSLTPTAGFGQTRTFTGTYSHQAGVSQLYLAYILLLPTPNIVQYTAAGSCLVEYNRISHAMRLINEAGDNWLGPVSGVPLGQGGTLSNSRCTLNIGASGAQVVGSSLVVNANVSLKPSFSGTLGTFLQAEDVNGVWSGMTQFGNWTGTAQSGLKPGPYLVGMSPAASTGNTTYTVTTGHTSGLSHLAVVHVRINSGIVGGAPCHIVYFPGSNTVNLVNDAETALVLPVPVLLNSATIGTGRCILRTTGSRTISGNNLTLRLPVDFISPAFSGMKSVYVNAFDIAGALTHWVQTGTVTVP
jgi:hypothetical protein